MVEKGAFIFDMDGVIIDSEPVYQSLNSILFAQLGIEVDEQFQLEYVGVTKWTKWKLLKERFNLHESIEALVERQNGIFQGADWQYKKLLFPDALPLLEELQNKDIPVALASSSGRERINQVLEECGLEAYFQVVVAGDEVKNGKPDPEIFLTAAKQLDVPAENCVVVEDSHNGLIAAKHAKMYGIGVKNPQYKIDLSVADKIVSSLAEIKLVELI